MLCGWLSPEGKFHECNYWGHIDLAYDLCEQLGFSSENLPDEALADHGWIKCFYSVFDYKVQLYSNEEGLITEAQKSFLRHNYEEFPEDWGRGGKLELKFLGVLDPEYDEFGCLI